MLLSKTNKIQFQLINSYWVIFPNKEIPHFKVSLTRSDKRLFHVIFKHARLVWCGRKPINSKSMIKNLKI